LRYDDFGAFAPVKAGRRYAFLAVLVVVFAPVLGATGFD
jgi:hypothetical protein